MSATTFEELPTLRMRLHWASIVTGPFLLLIAVAIVLGWSSTHPGLIARWLHIYQGQPAALFLMWLRAHGTPIAATCAIAAAFVLLVRALSWSIGFIEISPTVFTYKQGPFSINQIATRAIQDIRQYQGLWGILLDYGTLVVDAGREQELLAFVPRFKEVKAALTPR